MDETNVFMRYYMLTRLYVKVPSGQEYIFVTRHNICGSMVHPDDVEFIKSKRGGCCGQSRAGVFTVGSERDRERWQR